MSGYHKLKLETRTRRLPHAVVVYLIMVRGDFIVNSAARKGVILTHS